MLNQEEVRLRRKVKKRVVICFRKEKGSKIADCKRKLMLRVWKRKSF